MFLVRLNLESFRQRIKNKRGREFVRKLFFMQPAIELHAIIQITHHHGPLFFSELNPKNFFRLADRIGRNDVSRARREPGGQNCEQSYFHTVPFPSVRISSSAFLNIGTASVSRGLMGPPGVMICQSDILASEWTPRSPSFMLLMAKG